MIKLMRSKKGASSILVILLLIVLVVFGVAALTTALSNVRLGQKVVDWNEKYYAAEAQANEVYAQIDSVVKPEWLGWLVLSSYQFDDIADSVKALDFEVKTIVKKADIEFGEEATQHDSSIDFTYETWQEDVGLRVTLSLGMDSDELTITEWRVIQQ
ncbi:MAG: hypothetical protein HN948_07090 [Clostridia bacterium]|jgi:hypothetical protein|nr:hypothetical protein [Clostridia bacterium]MBT7122758.1 hypothetical protein [Clostridia bacterium]